MKLDKETQELIDLLLSVEPDHSTTYSFDQIEELTGKDAIAIRPKILPLVRDGLAEITTYNTGHELGVMLTQPAIKYKELRSLERKERWIERLWGFLSGVGTTLLASFIVRWLSQ